jgi:hypothetical protein
MGLLATLPRATRGHLGAANRALTRATRGYLQIAGVARRRVSGGLFAPELPETEPYRRLTSVLIIGLDGNSDLAFGDRDDRIEVMTGRIWLDGGTTFTPGRQAPRLRVVDSMESASAPTPSPTAAPAQPEGEPEALVAPAKRQPDPRSTHIALGGGLVLASESRAQGGEAPTPVRADLAGGSLWLSGETRFRRLEIDVPGSNSDEELALIIAMLEELL